MSQINPIGNEVRPATPAMGRAPQARDGQGRPKRQPHHHEPEAEQTDTPDTDTLDVDTLDTSTPPDPKATEKPAHLDIKA